MYIGNPHQVTSLPATHPDLSWCVTPALPSPVVGTSGRDCAVLASMKTSVRKLFHLSPTEWECRGRHLGFALGTGDGRGLDLGKEG